MIVTPRAALLALIESQFLDLHTSMPCQIVSYNAETQRANIQPLAKHVLKDRDGTEIEENYPQIPDVPVFCLSGGGAFQSFPISAGDIGLGIFCEWPVDQIFEKGVETHPVILERHSLNGAICIVGLRVNSEPISEDLSEHAMFGFDGGLLFKALSDGTAEIGTTAGTKQFAALGNVTDSNDDALLDATKDLATAISSWVPVANDGGAALKTALASWITTVGSLTVASAQSSKVKVQE